MALCSEKRTGRGKFAAVCDAPDCKKDEILGEFDSFDEAGERATELGWREDWVELPGTGGAKFMGLFCPDHIPNKATI
jgi:hypothetical protein